MTPSDAINDDEQFTLLLARYSDLVSTDGEADPLADADLPDDLRLRLRRALDCVRRMRRIPPQAAESLDPYLPPRDNDVTLIQTATITLHDGLAEGQVGRFRILRLLGGGGGGMVFLAYDPELRREVALKMPRLEALFTPELRQRFVREARAAAGLDHPNLVPVYEVGEANGMCFLVSAYCRGGSLAERLKRQTVPVRLNWAAELLIQLADAVQYVHGHGVYHRDIKPGNILLDAKALPSAGELPFTPRLCDFGLAKLREAQTELTRSGVVLGTPSYMAPEQVEGRKREIGPATDVYGLGAVLYELLTGRPPFKGGSDAETLRQVLAEEPVPPRRLRRDVPRDLETICLKCLHKEPAWRYGSAADLAGELRRFRANEPIRARRPRWNERMRKWTMRHPVRVLLLAALLLGGLSFLAGWFHLTTLERKHRVDRTAVAKQGEEQRLRLGRHELLLRQQRYAEDIAQAWWNWENRRPEDIGNSLNNHRSPSSRDEADDLRGFEWYYLSRLGRARPRVMRHSANLFSAAFSPDGTTCASGHEDGAIALWDPASGQQRRILDQHKLPVFALAYSPDGKYLVSGSSGGENGKLRGELLLWDARTGNRLLDFPTPLGAIHSLAFSPDGRTLATVILHRSGGGDIKFWEMPSGRERTTISFPQPGGAASVAFSSDGATVVIGHVDGTISLHDAATGRVLKTRLGHQGRVWSIACGHKDAVFVSGGGDGKVRLSSLRPDGSPVEEYWHEDIVWSVAFSPDDRSVATISHEMLKVWDRENQRMRFSSALHGVKRKGRVAIFSPDGRTLAVGGEYGSLWMYDYGVLHAAETLSWLGHSEGKEPREAWAVAFSPDGKILASAGDDAMIRLWDAANGRELAVLRSHQSLVTSLAFSPDGKWLASGSFDEQGPLKLWKVANGEEIATLNGHHNRVDSVVFSPDGKILATSGRDGITRLWDTTTWRDRPFGSGRNSGSLAFSPDSRTLALESDSQILLWDIEEGKTRQILPPHPPGHIAVAFSPDGKTLATGDIEGVVRFFDAATGELRIGVRVHTDQVNCLAFTPDGKTLASASFDRKVKLWQAATGRELLTLPEQKDRVRWLTFSPDGASLATAGHDGSIHIYRADRK
jgi:WD40 repeat protein/tRNA A-37 threonylcarbamoyl transferase component Bud32